MMSGVKQGNALLVVLFVMSFTVMYSSHYWFSSTLLYQGAYSQAKIDKNRHFIQETARLFIEKLAHSQVLCTPEETEQHYKIDTPFFRPGSHVTVSITNDLDTQKHNACLCTFNLIMDNETLSLLYALRYEEGFLQAEPISIS